MSELDELRARVEVLESIMAGSSLDASVRNLWAAVQTLDSAIQTLATSVEALAARISPT